MVLCVCKVVTEGEVAALVRAGARSVDEIASRCGAGTDCGACVEAIEEHLGCQNACADCPRKLSAQGMDHAA